MRGLTTIVAVGLALAAVQTAEAGVARARALKTGQTTTYGAVGDTTAGIARSYVDLGNGVIKDQKTALFWEKKSDDGSIHDKDIVVAWSGAAPNASQFLAVLNSGCFGGYCDWRLPTLNELETIRDIGKVNPSVPAVFNTGCTPGCTVTTCSCTVSNGYWSSSTLRDYPGYAWAVNFGQGIAGYADKPASTYVRAVRP